jgi:hypothetical protein
VGFLFIIFEIINNIKTKKGGAIYIASSNVPKLSTCIFNNNSCSDLGFGNDIVYNTNSKAIYSTSNIENTCSTSSSPHITGNTTDIIISLNDCSTSNNEYYNVCVNNEEIIENNEDNNSQIIIFIIIISILFFADILILIIIIIIYPKKKKPNQQKLEINENVVNYVQADLTSD